MSDDVDTVLAITPARVIEEAAAVITPDPGVTMPIPTKHKAAPVRRQAKPPPRRRNASMARLPARVASAVNRRLPTNAPAQRSGLVQLGETVLGALVGSVGGALATRWGFHPELVSAALGGVGGAVALKADTERWRNIASGCASAGGSQYLLLRLRSTPEPPKIVVTATPTPAPTQALPQLPAPGRKNADMGELPPGMLDAAFERARAELAVNGDGYPHDYEHPHHLEHERHRVPFMP